MRAIIIFFISLLPLVAHAEVMDKEFSFLTVVLLNLIGTILVFLAARLKPWILLILLPVLGTLFYLHLTELIDPYVGPAIAKEAGEFYIFSSWLAPVLVIIGGSIGFILRRRNIKSTANISIRRALLTSAFMGLGIFASWSTLRLLALVDWSKVTYARPEHCWEVDHCNVPWYFLALYIAILLVPTATHAIVGWRLNQTDLQLNKVIKATLTLWVATLVFYAVGRIASGY